MQKSEGWTPYDVDFRFSCMLVCNNPHCGEVVVVSGSVELEEQISYDELGGSTDYIEFFIPKSMYPAPPVIPISEKLSRDCREDLQKAFSLLWVDVAACAARQRTMIEHLLDQLGIPRHPKGKRPNLHSRIECLAEAHPDYGEILDALKEVGNAGSHESKASFKDVVDCFELIEHVVTALVDRPQDGKMQVARRLKAKYAKPSGPDPALTFRAEKLSDNPVNPTPISSSEEG